MGIFQSLEVRETRLLFSQSPAPHSSHSSGLGPEPQLQPPPCPSPSSSPCPSPCLLETSVCLCAVFLWGHEIPLVISGGQRSLSDPGSGSVSLKSTLIHLQRYKNTDCAGTSGSCRWRTTGDPGAGCFSVSVEDSKQGRDLILEHELLWLWWKGERGTKTLLFELLLLTLRQLFLKPLVSLSWWFEASVRHLKICLNKRLLFLLSLTTANYLV